MEVFLPGIDQSKVDKSTEEWLDGIEERLECGNCTADITILQRRWISFRSCSIVLLCWKQIVYADERMLWLIHIIKPILAQHGQNIIINNCLYSLIGAFRLTAQITVSNAESLFEGFI